MVWDVARLTLERWLMTWLMEGLAQMVLSWESDRNGLWIEEMRRQMCIHSLEQFLYFSLLCRELVACPLLLCYPSCSMHSPNPA